MPALQVNDYVVARIHKIVRTAGEKKGKLVPIVEGPFVIDDFTDETRQVAVLLDADGKTWKKRTADLSKHDIGHIDLT